MKKPEFFIKKSEANVEEHFWQNVVLKSRPLSRERVVSEKLTLAFYSLMGISTPKTYIDNDPDGKILISRVVENCKSIAVTPMQDLPVLDKDLIDLARFELAAAVIGDYDATGWSLENIVINGDKRIIKFDGGTNLLFSARCKFLKSFFSNQSEELPDGPFTLVEDNSLETTYLKVYLVDNIGKLNNRFKGVFQNITPEDRKVALRELFKIQKRDLFALVNIVPDSECSVIEKLEIITNIMDRIEVFKLKYQQILTGLPENQNDEYPEAFEKILRQKNFDKKNWQERLQLDTTYYNPEDYSQSKAQKYIKSNAEGMSK